MSRVPELAEWKTLGFWFEYAETQKIWLVRGTRAGIAKFAILLQEYADNPHHAELSEHRHYGPYFDLKITTWSVPRISEEGIWGSLKDISQLAATVRRIANTAPPGEVVRVSDEYGSNNSAALEVIIVHDDESVFF